MGLVIAWLLGWQGAALAECENGSFNSTFALIQKAIFENHGCTNRLCHGSAAAGLLDLRPDVAYDNLVDVNAATVEGMKRILAGQSTASLFWINLAAKTFPSQYKAPIRAMPQDPEPALSAKEIEALRLWIEQGAPRNGVVPGTADLLDACLPPPEPLAVKPLEPPAPGNGVQIVMPTWALNANSETEVCFATYYDVTDQVPPDLRQADGTFLWSFHQTRQDPLSHHMVPILYEGQASVDSPEWGSWKCTGGAREGETCEPTDLSFCGAGAWCRTEIRNSVGCLAYGPGDGGIGFTSPGISVTQQTAEEFQLPPGVYRSLPMKGIILWSSHAFNLTDKAGDLRAWLNFEFTPAGEARSPAQQVFDAAGVFKMSVPPYQTREVCSYSTFAPDTRLFELSSHTHKRGKRWRTFLGKFACASGPNAGQPCSPLGYDMGSPDACAGAPCVSTRKVPVGDCDLGGSVQAAELRASVDMALDSAPIDTCRDADADGNWKVSIEELVTSVNAANQGIPERQPRDGRGSLLYTNLNYNDPSIVHVDPPLVFPGANGREEDRVLTFCALYDNGYTNPDEVKRRSTSPPPPFAFPGIGGPCETPTHCTAGRIGSECSGRLLAARHASCNTTPESSDGVCDACPLQGGVTTEDEMFILLGYTYQP